MEEEALLTGHTKHYVQLFWIYFWEATYVMLNPMILIEGIRREMRNISYKVLQKTILYYKLGSCPQMGREQDVNFLIKYLNPTYYERKGVELFLNQLIPIVRVIFMKSNLFLIDHSKTVAPSLSKIFLATLLVCGVCTVLHKYKVFPKTPLQFPNRVLTVT